MWDQEGPRQISPRTTQQQGPAGARPERAETGEESRQESHQGADVAMRFPSRGAPGGLPLSDTEDDETLERDTPPPNGDMRDETWLRMRARRMIREFLRAVPRSEPEAALSLMRPDGEMRQLTRADLSRAIDRLRPRQRQIIRLGIEERWPRAKVCAYLHDISMKTLERDQVEALDLLTQL
jgi:hypothetical protein